MANTELVPATPAAPTTTTTAKAPVAMGVAPQDLEQAWRLAQMMAQSELVPKNFRLKPNDVLVAIQMGTEVGFAPMQALQSIAVINGRPGIWGDGFLALIMSSPLYQDHDEFFEVNGERRDGLTVEDLKKDDTAAVCTFVRVGKATPVTRRFTIGQAKKAGLLGKEGPWQQYPDRMLQMRARSFAGRDAFPDKLRGISTAEELRDVPVNDEPPPMRVVRRLSNTQLAAQSTVVPTATDGPVDEPGIVVIGRVVEVDLESASAVVETGEVIVVTSPADLGELQKFVGTPHVLNLSCGASANGELVLRSLQLAE